MSPDLPEQLLTGKEIDPLKTKSNQDYTLRLDPETDDWSGEIELAWLGENGGRGTTRNQGHRPPAKPEA